MASNHNSLTLQDHLLQRAQTLDDPRVSYEAAGGWIGQPARSPVLRRALGDLVQMNKEAEEPLLSSLVVLKGERDANGHETLGFPAEGFWIACKDRDAQPPKTDDLAFWTDQLEKIQRRYRLGASR